jgi:methylmalonyl-CoA/ethylmalonyl-CoA epimerase
MLTFHHLGVATQSLDAGVAALRALGYEAAGKPFTDTSQGVRGLFLVGPGPQLELLEQLPGSHVLDSWLKRGVRIYHQGFLSDELDADLRQLQERGALVVSRPTPAVAFEGRQICFLMLRDEMMVELIAA